MDTIVLGAGIIGVSVAIHLAERGRSVLLIDRRGLGKRRPSEMPACFSERGIALHRFPQDLATILRHARNRSIDSHYHASALPLIGPFLRADRRHSRSTTYRRIQQAYEPLIARSIEEHALLVDKAGAAGLIRKDGWISGYRSAFAFDTAAEEADRIKQSSASITPSYQPLISPEWNQTFCSLWPAQFAGSRLGRR